MFLNKTPQEVLDVALARLVRDTDITVTSPGGIARTWFELIADEVGNDFAIFDANAMQLFLSTAGGKALDLFGQMFGLTRKTVSGTVLANVSNVLFYLSDQQTNTGGIASHPAPERITIPAGTSIASAPLGAHQVPTLWKTATPTILESGQYMAYADVTPVQSLGDTTAKGSLIYHDFNAGGIASLTGNNPPLYVQVYNREDLEIKTSYESDTNFRYRIRYAIRTLAAGNVYALRLAALAVPGIRDCKVYPLAEGVGTAKVVIVTEQPGTAAGDAAFTTASTAVMDARSVGDVLFVRHPSELPVEVQAALYFRPGTSAVAKSSISKNVQDAIVRNVNRLGAGEALRINKLTYDAMQVSPDIENVVIIPGVGLIVNSTPQPISDYNVTEEEQLFASSDTVTVLTQ